ncbi:VWA domain-containing protein [Lutibaculum baratangense]|uniref:von Willebrand factor type A domain protein, associated with Flp pilus assembly n=1 Tax=Lutibaculum baratangense AMV1 TaxID=631454 RepID=V4RHQ5_9HYPH|nr:VWA domain-containing protein [Lutibaculum baratangense]ESR25661.1 Von Willebrand factor type A domain protein, associated with Flp pilus assembly [Lutibaculum baratangense AMV1]
MTLSPGTYCGGLHIHRDAVVHLMPGVYVIKDGPLIVGPGGPVCKGGENDDDDDDDDEGEGCHRLEHGATLKGDNVAFYFTGDLGKNPVYGDSMMRFEPASVVEISAPKDGPLAGILLFEDRNMAPNLRYEVLSVKARKLVGTIYLPRGRFVVDTDEDVSQDSAYTAIVANRLMLRGSPRLFLNTDYHRTDVPVPAGVGPVGTSRLTK